MKDEKPKTVSRRSFFGTAGKGVAVGVGAAVTAAASGVEAAEEPSAGGGYRETAHVKTYYESTKF